MRVLIAPLALLVTCLCAGQTSQELHSRYGEPDVERFTPRPGIALSVEYGLDNLPCQIVLERRQPLKHADAPAKYMNTDTVSEILDEIMPISSRGLEISSFRLVSGASEVTIVDYENVQISRAALNYVPLQPERESQATVTHKRQICLSMPD